MQMTTLIDGWMGRNLTALLNLLAKACATKNEREVTRMRWNAVASLPLCHKTVPALLIELNQKTEQTRKLCL